ncbi:MAG: TolC family protein [Litorimonas sp.]
MALRLAADNNPTVAIALSDLDAANAGLTEAKSLRRPQVSAFTQSGFGDEGLVNSAIENQVGLRASQRLFDFGDSRLAKEAAKEQIQVQESLVLDARSRAQLEAGLSYIDWFDATERLLATVDRADYFAQELSALEIALETGGATRSEVAEIAAESADADADRYELEFEREQALTRLQIATRTDYPPCQHEGARLDAYVNVLSDGQTTQDYLRQALSTNGELQALSSLAKKLDLEAERQKRSRLPVLEVVGITSLTTDRRFDTFEFRERIGFDASVPLLTGSSFSARTDRAQAQARRAGYEADEDRKNLEEQVQSIHKRTLLLNAQLGRRQAVIEYRTVEFDAATTGYENNIRTLPELVDIRLQLEEARLAEIRTRYTYFRQALTLKSLTGALN